MSDEKPSDLRMLRRPEVEKLTALPSTTIDRLESQGHFPRRVKLSERCVAWPAATINAWLASKIAEAGAEQSR